MYWKLAIQNIRRSLRDYIIYFVTLTLTALCDVLLFRDELFYYESFGLFTSNNQIAIDIGVGSDDTESSVLKKYFPIYSYVQQITDDDSLTLSINSNELYAMRKKLISDNRADQMLNEDEYNDWNSKEIQISEPFIYEYTDGWSNVWE